MTPEELASHHPCLYHVTEPSAVETIKSWGLISTSKLLDKFEVHGSERELIESRRRPQAIPISHPLHGTAVINDNIPLSEAALAKCLDDGLVPSEWLRILNQRIFLWPDEKQLARHLNAKINRDRERAIIVFDTLSLAGAHIDRLELSPINGGSTMRRPARRGLKTFSPAREHSYDEWRRLRGKLDRPKEMAVRDGIEDARHHIVTIRFE